MTNAKRRLLTASLLATGVVVCGACALAVPSVDNWIFERLVERSLRTGDKRLFQDDSLKVLLCGTSAPVADPHRAQSCVAILAGGKYYLVDLGPGSGRNLALWKLQGDRLGGVFLTHFHSDHIGDLGEVNTTSWLNGRPGRLQVYGGPGVDKVVAGINEAYSQDEAYRTATSNAVLLPPSTAPMQAIMVPLLGPETPNKNRLGAPIHIGNLTVTTIEVNHEPVAPAYGYRFDYHGRSVVISGDTNYHPPLAAAAQGADVLIHEAQSQHLVQLIQKAAEVTGNSRVAHIMGDIQEYHTDPQDAARIANQAHVRLLVFTHISPTVSNVLISRMYLRGVRTIRSSGWIIGRDGTLIELPAGSTDVKVSYISP